MTGAVVLLSAGLDSTVAFKKAFDTFHTVMCITFDYGQRAALREMENAAAMCEKFDCEHQMISLPWYSTFSGGLMGGADVPKPSLSELDDPERSQDTARIVWVPARNMVFLSIAAAFAERYDLDHIVAGFNTEEAATFPDNTPEFIQLFDKTLEYGTLNHPTIFAPLADLDKEAIVTLGLEIQAPLEYSWSCYTSDPVPCGTCESCMRRKRAFSRADVPDPLLIRLGKS